MTEGINLNLKQIDIELKESLRFFMYICVKVC